jgi:hypothetical protein
MEEDCSMTCNKQLSMLCLFVWLFVSWSAACLAETVPDIANYFRPVTGALVKIQGNDYLINLDAAKGITVGDLLTIVTPGEQLFDPVTREELGSLDTVHGVLKVSQVRSGFSQAKPVGPIDKAGAGAIVRRYQNLTAGYFDYDRSGKSLYEQLVTALPALEWQGYFAEQAGNQQTSAESISRFQLNFVQQHQHLTVYDQKGQALRSFSMTAASTSGDSGTSAPAVTVAAPLPSGQNLAPVTPVFDLQSGAAGQVHYSPDYPGYENLGNLSQLVLASAFFVRDNQQLLATSDEHQIQVYSLANPTQPITTERLPGLEKIHALAWWQPEPGGPLYLAVTASISDNISFSSSFKTDFSSLVFRWSDHRLQRLEHNLPYLLGSFDSDGDGSPETLLAQRFDLDVVFGTVKKLVLDHHQLVEQPAGFDLPLNFPVIGSAITDLTGDRVPELSYTRNGVLFIRGNKQQYESSKQMGGSLSKLTYNLNPGQADSLFRTVLFEVPPLVFDLDADGQKELIAVSSDRPALNAPGLGTGNSENWLTVIKHQSGMFVKGTLGERVENTIQGLFADHNRILLILSSQASFSDNPQPSHLVQLRLAQK